LSTNLYVGNLPFSMSADQLEALFAQHGAVVRAQVISDRETGRSRGFGFVEMESDDAAQAAISALNGQDHNGRRLNVNVARERSR
jgi:RNA recognition motif-containing protein